MDSIRFLSNESSQDDQSTIQLEFSETTVQIPATTHDLNSNSCASLHRYYARKRYPSTESQSTSSNEKGYMRKKQRNTHEQQIVSLSESDETQTIAMNLTRQEQKGRIIFQLERIAIVLYDSSSNFSIPGMISTFRNHLSTIC